MKRSMNIHQKLAAFFVFYSNFYVCSINYWYMTFGKNNLFRLLFYALIIIGSLGYFLQMIQKNEITKVEIILFVYFILIVFNYFFIGIGGIFDAIYPYVFLPLIFFSTRYFCNGEELKIHTIMILFIASAMVLAVIAISEYLTKKHFVEMPLDRYAVAFRSRAMADSCLSLGCQFAMMICICVYLYITSKKNIYILCVIFSVIALLMTESRGPLVAAIVAVMLMLGKYNSINGKARETIIFLLLGVLAFMFMIIISGLGFFESTTFNNRIIQRVVSTFNWSSDIGNLGRISRWKAHLAYYIKRPIFGNGVGFCEHVVGFPAESGIVQFLNETGIVGLSFYMAPIIYILKKSLGRITVRNSKTLDILPFAGMVIVFLVENIVLQIFDNTIIGFYTWFSLALLFELNKRINLKVETNND